MHTSRFTLYPARPSVWLHRAPCPTRRPGPRAGAQLRSSLQPRIGVRGRPRRLSLFSTGCGGVGSQRWAPASPLGGGDRRGPGRRWERLRHRFRSTTVGIRPSFRDGFRGVLPVSSVFASFAWVLSSRSRFVPSPACAGGVPFPRAIARACVRGRGRAYRGGAARAPDCARETADAPRPSVPAGVFFAAPSHRFLQKSRKAAPEAAPLYFHSTPYRRKSSPQRLNHEKFPMLRRSGKTQGGAWLLYKSISASGSPASSAFIQARQRSRERQPAQGSRSCRSTVEFKRFPPIGRPALPVGCRHRPKPAIPALQDRLS